jgi:FKBP-type peptidyl-prolyl cis-trans isomerase (trigger factor)
MISFVSATKTENPEENPVLQERIKKAALYFLEKTDLILQNLLNKTAIETDNKEIRKKMNETLGLFQTEVQQKRKTLESNPCLNNLVCLPMLACHRILHP